MASTIFSRSALSTGFETRMTALVFVSSSNAVIACKVMRPPTCFFMSLPPTPIACVIPEPKECRRVVDSCMPVPDAPIIPTFPGLIRFPNPKTTPLIMEVPASGPMNSTLFCMASFFSIISSSSGTWSLNKKT